MCRQYSVIDETTYKNKIELFNGIIDRLYNRNISSIQPDISSVSMIEDNDNLDEMIEDNLNDIENDYLLENENDYLHDKEDSDKTYTEFIKSKIITNLEKLRDYNKDEYFDNVDTLISYYELYEDIEDYATIIEQKILTSNDLYKQQKKQLLNELYYNMKDFQSDFRKIMLNTLRYAEKTLLERVEKFIVNNSNDGLRELVVDNYKLMFMSVNISYRYSFIDEREKEEKKKIIENIRTKIFSYIPDFFIGIVEDKDEYYDKKKSSIRKRYFIDENKKSKVSKYNKEYYRNKIGELTKRFEIEKYIKDKIIPTNNIQ